LLCGPYNRGLGCFSDDPRLQRSAAAWLIRALKLKARPPTKPARKKRPASRRPAAPCITGRGLKPDFRKSRLIEDVTVASATRPKRADRKGPRQSR